MDELGARLFRAFTLGSDAQRDVEAAVAASRTGGHAPVAVWVNPAVPEFHLTGVSVVRDRRMSKWMVYVEEAADEPQPMQLNLI